MLISRQIIKLQHNKDQQVQIHLFRRDIIEMI